MRIGYLVPEFPSRHQGHFWREIAALEAGGMEVDLVSTCRPTVDVATDDWAEEAIRRTTYLTPISGMGDLQLLRGMLVGRVRGLCTTVRRLGSEGMGQFPLLATAFRLVGLSRQRRWQHLHVHSCADAATVAMYARLMRGPAYSLTLHGDVSHFGPMQQQKWQHAEFAFASSEYLIRSLVGHVDTRTRSCVQVAPLGVDLDQFRREQPYQPWSAGEPVRLITCGDWHAESGHDELIRVVAQLREADYPAQLTIIGSEDRCAPGDELQLRELAAQLGLDDAICFAGDVLASAMVRELERSHLFTLARPVAGVMNIPTVEAMAMALPVVVADSPDQRELMTHGENGLLTPVGNSDQMCAQIVQLLENPTWAREIGTRARRRIELRHDKSASAQRLLTRLLGRTAPPVVVAAAETVDAPEPAPAAKVAAKR